MAVDTQELTRVEGSATRDDADMERMRLATAQRLLRSLPTSIGRYRVVGKIGEGGMGTVYRAHDPDLDRPVAIKLLKRHGVADVAEQARMLREARALAAVPHPNVIDIYEVGEHRGALFIAMEFVEAMDLREWLDYEDPSWREIVRVFVDAGRGLAAAHERGLVHRDFKPSNVLLGHDGRARVVDFGLAKGLYELSLTPSTPSSSEGLTLGPSSSPSETASASAHEGLALNLTTTGALIGTPAYMAPEQLRGTRSDASADQFAFCVSLWEGLFGARPFTGKNPKALLRAIEREPPRTPSRRDGWFAERIPPAIVRALRRGLAIDPRARFGRLDDLLDELDQALRRVRRAPLALGTVLVTAGLLASAVPAHSGPATCIPDEAALPRWRDFDRDPLERMYAASGQAEAWERLATGLDAYAASLTEAWSSACSGPAGSGSPAGLERDAQRACLHHRAVAATAVVEVLAETQQPVSTRLLASLPPAASCLQATSTTAMPPPGDAEAIAALERELTRAGVLQLADQQERALALLDTLYVRATSLDWAPLRARVLVTRAGVLVALGRHEEAVRDLETAFDAARGAGDDEAARTASAKLAHVLGVEMNRSDDGLMWARHSEAAARRLGLDDPLGHLRVTLGLIHVYAGHSDEAVRHLEIASAQLATPRADATARDRYEAHRQLGAVLLHLGRATVAREHFEVALALAEEHYGPRSHDVAAMSFNLGLTVAAEGRDLARAHELFAAAAALYAELLPDAHPDIGDATFQAGLMLARMGRLDAAKETIERGLSILENGLGADDPFSIQARLSFAEVLFAADDIDATAQVVTPAHASAQARLGQDHPLFGRAARILGDVAMARGDLASARTHYEASLPAVAGTEPRTADLRVETLLSLVELERHAGNLDQAERWADECERGVLALHGRAHPRTAEIRLRILPLRLDRDDLTVALDEAEAALELVLEAGVDPAFSTEAGLHVAQALARVGRTEAAARVATRALASMPESTPPERADSLRALAGSGI